MRGRIKIKRLEHGYDVYSPNDDTNVIGSVFFSCVDNMWRSYDKCGFQLNGDFHTRSEAVKNVVRCLL